jgi:hypothetical protein
MRFCLPRRRYQAALLLLLLAVEVSWIPPVEPLLLR